MTVPAAFISSVRIEPGGGSHEYVTVWIRGANVGTLCVGKGDGERLEALLLPLAIRARRFEMRPPLKGEALDKAIEAQARITRGLEATGKADAERFARRLEQVPSVSTELPASAGTEVPGSARTEEAE